MIMKHKFVKDGKFRYLIVWDCENHEDVWTQVCRDINITSQIEDMDCLLSSQNMYSSQNDDGTYHAFYFLN
jgi:hypothetical protein